jgi:YfiH family protein
MIQKLIQTKFSTKINFSVWGKEETKELEGISKEGQTEAIRNFVSAKLKIPANKVYLLEQVHGDRFYNTKDLVSRKPTEGDALFTTEIGEVLVVKTADCMPLFFWSESEKIIGIIHSGWKGTELGISEKLFFYLRQNGYSLNTIQAYLGPCARKKNYEVAKELFEKFKKYSPEAIEPKGDDKYLLGLNYVIKKRLEENKLPVQFSDCEICTMEDSKYHSHRRGDTGRNLNLIWME